MSIWYNFYELIYFNIFSIYNLFNYIYWPTKIPCRDCLHQGYIFSWPLITTFCFRNNTRKTLCSFCLYNRFWTYHMDFSFRVLMPQISHYLAYFLHRAHHLLKSSYLFTYIFYLPYFIKSLLHIEIKSLLWS